MKHLTTLLILALSISSCTQRSVLQTIVAIESDTTPDLEMLAATQKSIATRLNDAGFKGGKVTFTPDQKHLQVEVMIDPNNESEMSHHEALFSDYFLEIWPTYYLTDFEGQNLGAKLPQPSMSFIPYPLLPNVAQTEVIGMCTDSTDLPNILSALEDSLSSFNNLKILVSESFSDHYFNENEGQLFYLINTEGHQSAPLSNKDIVEASAELDPYMGMPTVFFSFSKQAAILWAKMTQKAAQEGNRSIAIVINDRVITVPRVQETITGGKCQISGNFTLAEAEGIAQSLRSVPLPYPVKVLSSSIKKP